MRRIGLHILADGLLSRRMPYLYEGLEASLYDQLDELSGFDDFPFYRWFAETNGGKVLDLGCGTGRILLPLVKSGLSVTGLEYAPEMLEICRSNLENAGLDAQLVQGDMSNFDLGQERFSTVLIPGYSIQLLLEESALRSCLESCRRHLADGGQVVIPTYMPWDMIWDSRDSMDLEERRSVVDASSGAKITAFQGWRLDSQRQQLHLINRFESRDPNGALLDQEEKEMAVRWTLPHEMLSLLSEAGFSDVSMYGDFEFDPPEEDSESVIYVARI